MPKYFDLRGIPKILAVFAVSSLLTIAAGANLRFAGGVAGGALFLDASKNASSTARLQVDGNTGTLSASSTITSTGGNIATAAGVANIVCNGTNANCTIGQTNGASGFLQVNSGGDTTFQTWNGSSFTPRMTIEGNQSATEINIFGGVSSTVVTSSRFIASAGTLTQPSFALPGSGNGLYLDTTDSVSIAAGGQRNFIVRAAGTFSQVPFQPSSDLGTTLGTQTVRWSNLFSQTVSSTNMRVMTSLVSESAGVANLGTSVSDRFGSLYAGLAVGTCTLCITGGSGYELYTLSGSLDIRTAGGNVKMGPGSAGNTTELYSNAQESLPQLRLSGDGNAIEFMAGNTTTRTFISNATSTQIIGWGNTVTSTLTVGTSSTRRGCVPIGDADGSGFTYLTVNNGVGTFSLTPCDR